MLGLHPYPVAVTLKGHGGSRTWRVQEHIQRLQEVLVLFNTSSQGTVTNPL